MNFKVKIRDSRKSLKPYGLAGQFFGRWVSCLKSLVNYNEFRPKLCIFAEKLRQNFGISVKNRRSLCSFEVGFS